MELPTKMCIRDSLVRLDGVKKVSLLAKYGMTEADAYKLCHCLLYTSLLPRRQNVSSAA